MSLGTVVSSWEGNSVTGGGGKAGRRRAPHRKHICALWFHSENTHEKVLNIESFLFMEVSIF